MTKTNKATTTTTVSAKPGARAKTLSAKDRNALARAAAALKEEEAAEKRRAYRRERRAAIKAGTWRVDAKAPATAAAPAPTVAAPAPEPVAAPVAASVRDKLLAQAARIQAALALIDALDDE